MTTTTRKMKLHAFVNGTYMRPIQFGIQTAHLCHAMAHKYLIESDGTQRHMDAAQVFKDWITPTVCAEPYIHVLDGKNLERLSDLHNLIARECDVMHLPHGCFHESVGALGGILTVTGFVIPDDALISSPTVVSTYTVQDLITLSAFRGTYEPYEQTSYDYRTTAPHILTELLLKSSFAR